jgi:hypothetical protein
MEGFQDLTPVQLDSLNRELDIFDAGQAPRPDLLQRGLHPPLPICSDTLIWGFDILRSVKDQDIEQLHCRLIPPCSKPEMLALALKLEDRAGAYSWIEKEKMLGFLVRDSAGPSNGDTGGSDAAGGPQPKELQISELPEELIKQMQDLSPLIENHPDPQLAARICRFAAFPQVLKSLVAGGQIDLKSADRVQSLPEEVFREIADSSLTFAQRRRFLNELFEVRGKLDLAERDIKNTVRQALGDAHPLDMIHKLRSPMLSSLEERFASLRQDLLQGSGVQLKSPPYFEGEAFTVEFAFHSAKSLARKLDALRELEGRLDALFELLH